MPLKRENALSLPMMTFTRSLAAPVLLADLRRERSSTVALQQLVTVMRMISARLAIWDSPKTQKQRAGSAAGQSK